MNAESCWLGSCGLVAVVALGCHSPQAIPPSGPVPVADEPRHHLVFENAIARVLDVQVPAGDTTLYHVHTYPNLGVVIQGARSWAQSQYTAPGEVEIARAAAALLDNWAQELPYTHRVGNADSVAFHCVISEWRGTSGVDCTSLADGGLRRLAKEGRFFRVYEIRLAPHAATESHRHSCPGLTVLATMGLLGEDGKTSGPTGGAGAGQWEWRNAGVTHALRNDGDTPLTAFEIDWR